MTAELIGGVLEKSIDLFDVFERDAVALVFLPELVSEFLKVGVRDGIEVVPVRVGFESRLHPPFSTMHPGTVDP